MTAARMRQEAVMGLGKRHLARRTVLGGLGATVGLPLLDAMIPAHTALAQSAAAPPRRFLAIEIVHGAAGSTELGRARNYWSPAQAGRDFTFGETLQPFERLRDYVTIVSGTRLRNAESHGPDEDGDMVDHARSSSVFLTAAHPRATTGADISCGPSIDQVYARRIAGATPIASLQLCLDDGDLGGACAASYSCAYTHTISWAARNKPLPMERSPRAVFDQLFAVTEPRAANMLDAVRDAVSSLRRELGSDDRRRLAEHLDAIRALERRIQAVEQDPARSGDLPRGVPASFDEHAALMFELLRLAFATDSTRVATLKLGTDRSQRIYPGSGVETPFHTLSHHRQIPEKVEEFARLNRYHAALVAQFCAALQASPDGDGNLLDHSLVLYGSPMGDSHVHDHRFLPLLLAGHGNGTVRGNQHVRCADDTPMANLLLTLLHRLDVPANHIGDSTGDIAI